MLTKLDTISQRDIIMEDKILMRYLSELQLHPDFEVHAQVQSLFMRFFMDSADDPLVQPKEDVEALASDSPLKQCKTSKLVLENWNEMVLTLD